MVCQILNKKFREKPKKKRPKRRKRVKIKAPRRIKCLKF